MIANPTYRDAKRRGQGMKYLVAALVALCVFLVVVDLGLVGAQALLRRAGELYDGRIYPQVYVLGLDLGGLTPQEAVAALGAARPDGGSLLLRDGDRQYAVPWPEAGLRLDVDATVQEALLIGHGERGLPAQLAALLQRHDVAPVFVVDPGTARRVLEGLAGQVSQPAVEASLRLEGGRAVAVPGQPGRALDVEATLPALISAAGRGQVDLVFGAAQPQVADASPYVARAEELLGRRLELVAYDVLTDETFRWTLDRDAIAGWLRVVDQGAEGPGLQLDRDAVRTTLAGLERGLGQGRGLRLDEATALVVQGFEAGGGAIQLYLTHPARTHVVQPGEILGSIAARYGMPPGLIAEANPGLDWNLLQPGQGLAIPSQDVLTPNLPVDGKRIVVSIGEQRMRVYEQGQLRYEWLTSTGIASSPTNTGTFQVLSKVENAYASKWDLWMPHFMAVYDAGGDFYNGIHALPILSSGQQLWGGLLGRPASFGCIILGVEEAAILYDWAEVGVTVVIE